MPDTSDWTDDSYEYHRQALRARLADVAQEPGSAKPQPIPHRCNAIWGASAVRSSTFFAGAVIGYASTVLIGGDH